MNARQKKTLEGIFERPTRPDIRWADIESLLRAVGAELSEGRGSRRRVSLNNIDYTFHRPHPRPHAGKGLVDDVRALLQKAGIEP